MKSVYENGIENTAKYKSTIAKLAKYFLSSGEVRFPISRTSNAKMFKKNAVKAVNVYKSVKSD